MGDGLGERGRERSEQIALLLRDGDEQTSVTVGLGVAREHPPVAVHFHGEAEPPRLEPERRIPGEEREQDGRAEQQAGITGVAMLGLVAEHQLA